MAAQPTTSMGCKLKRGDGAQSEAFTEIGEIVSFTTPSLTLTAMEVTALDDAWKKYIPSIPDGGEIDVEFNYVSGEAQQVGLETDFINKTTRNWELTLNDAVTTVNTKYAFAGIVVQYQAGQMAVDKPVTGRAKIKITGAVTPTRAS